MSRSRSHIYQFLFIVFIAIIGYIGWLNYSIAWVKTIWILMYSLLLVMLVLLGLVDYFLFNLSLGSRIAFGNVRDFFLTPLPYLVLWFFSKFFTQKRN